MEQNRLAPYCIEAEEAILGSILIDPDSFFDVRSIVEPTDFFREKNRWVFDAMVAIVDRGEVPDQIAVWTELRRWGKLDEVGGPAYLSHLIANTPPSVYAKHYAQIVAKESFRRRMITTGARIAAIAYEGNGDSMDLYVQGLETMVQLQPENKEEIVNPEQHAEIMLDMLSRRRERRSDNVLFGYRGLDDFIGGMYGGDFVIIGARPAVGKSQLLLEIGLHNAKSGRRVLFASAEMSRIQLAERQVVMGAGIDIRRLRRGELAEPEWDKAQAVVHETANIPFYLLTGKLSAMNIIQEAKILKQTAGLDLVLVDYIQLLRDRADKKAGDTLRERIGFVSSILKNGARDLDIPIVAASQLSRGVESRPGHRPMVADLKESGDLEQDADVVLLLHRPELYEPDKDNGVLEIGIPKVRQLGLQGVVKLVWVGKEHRYRDTAK